MSLAAKSNSGQASHLFGFKTWGETKAFLRVLWTDLVPPGFDVPQDAQHRDILITEFEKCLITKMRFHRAMSIKTLACIWGRDHSTIGRYIDDWAGKWGEAGEDFSILPIGETDFVEMCPVSYKEQELEMVGVVPDGKDFMHEKIRSSPCSPKRRTPTRCITWQLASSRGPCQTD